METEHLQHYTYLRTGVAIDGYDGDIGVGVGVDGRCGPMRNAASGAPGGPVHRVLRSARVRRDRFGIRQDTPGSWIGQDAVDRFRVYALLPFFDSGSKPHSRS